MAADWTTPSGNTYQLTETDPDGRHISYNAGFLPPNYSLIKNYGFGLNTLTITDSGPYAGQAVTFDTTSLTQPAWTPLSNYEALQGIDVVNNASVGFTWAASAPLSNEMQLLNFSVYDQNTGQQIFSQLYDSTATAGVNLSSSLFSAYHTYSYSIDAYNRLPLWVDGLGGFVADTSFIRQVNGTFQTTPEPTAIIALGFGLVGLLRKRGRSQD